jgi:hypothetical protein
MRNFWTYSFLAVMYLFFTWAIDEAFAADIQNKGQTRLEQYLKTKKKPILPLLKNIKMPVQEKRVKRQTSEESFLNTLSLSYNGDFEMSDYISQGKEMMGLLASTLGSLVNMNMVRNVVDNVYERFNGRYSTLERQGRSDLPSRIQDDRLRSDLPSEQEQQSQENIKQGITTLVGAALGEQQCVERSACLAGEYAAQFPGKDVLFLALDRFLPDSWSQTVNTFKQSATYIQDCEKFICTTESEKPRSPQARRH